jgi:N-acetylmuramoyl-L-alanine amidase
MWDHSFRLTSILLISLGLGASGFGSANARAAEDDPASPVVTVYSGPVSADEIYQRTQAVLQYFNVPAEPDSEPLLSSFQGLQTSEGIQSLLPYFDPTGELAGFSSLTSSSLNVFQDHLSLQIPDYSVSLLDASSPIQDSSAVQNLHAAQTQTNQDLPLKGLKIALDPGHMGGNQWDHITGKFVRDSQGRQLSEGILTLQTAMLLAPELESLGAQVMITRHSLKPVTPVDYASFDLHERGLDALRENDLASWFQNLIVANPAGQDLFDSFSQDPGFKGLFNENMRETYFDDLDLQARVDEIEAFQPDLTLIIHYNTSSLPPNPHGVDPAPAGTRDSIMAYVPGAFGASNFASRDDRVQLAKHLLDSSTWNASVAFARVLVDTLSSNLGLPFDKFSPGAVKTVEPGIFSRNLYLLKKYQGSVTAYVECLFYSDQGEFEAFYDAPHPMMIDGQNLPYSDRLAKVESSLKQAVLQFVQTGF